ncbi:hypothetical protein SmJEL517_g04017 [Synchytrium microbalum]|uniref:Uncharacterized protein n=1 Tax=Synchytrium microbalum TaxID=1806994 RepID=A0A507C0T5_9FUNG|nr:uncharacterized protein SmJEL517_g04017 [Synchytrium microbalum]TPX32978.1 hypothetical protein SmJEL517_g04017 [Synchytrium microbalum]
MDIGESAFPIPAPTSPYPPSSPISTLTAQPSVSSNTTTTTANPQSVSGTLRRDQHINKQPQRPLKPAPSWISATVRFSAATAADKKASIVSIAPTRTRFFQQIDVAKQSIHLALAQLVVVGGLETVVLVYTCDMVTWWLKNKDYVMNNGSSECADHAEFAASDLAFLSLYFCLFIVAMIYQLVMVFDSARQKNAAQAMATQFFNMAAFGYSAIQLKQLTSIYSQDCGLLVPVYIGQRIQTCISICIAIVVLMAPFVAMGLYLSLSLWREYRWSVFTEQSGAMLMLGVALYFAAAYEPQIDATGRSPQELGLGTVIIDFIILAIVCLGYFGIGLLAVRRGSKAFMTIFLGIMLVDLCALGFVMYVTRMDMRFEGTVVFLTWFISIQLIVNLATMWTGARCFLDFARFENYRKMVRPKPIHMEELQRRSEPILD